MRLPWTIWRHVLAEVWRLVLLTTGVLVTVIAFAVTVRYTAEGKLGPADTLKYMGLAMVPMLEYVLPFAAGFAATIAYHRMTQDNELTAAKASGVSHRALLVPAALTGAVLAGLLVLLNGEVIPRFLRSMEQMITEDAARMVARSIDQGEPVEFGSRLIYADRVYRLPARPERGGPYEVLLLTGVAALDLGPRGSVIAEMTAPQALVQFFAASESEAEGWRAPDGLTVATLDLKNATGRDKRTAGGGSVRWVFPIQGVFRDDPKFYTDRELLELPGDPDRLNMVDARRRELALRIAERRATRALDGSLRAQGWARLTDAAGRTFDLRGSGVRWAKPRWELLPGPAGAIEVDVYGAGKGGKPDPAERVSFTCTSGGLRTAAGGEGALRRLELTLELEGAAAQSQSGPAGTRTKKTYGGLTPADNSLAELMGKTSFELLEVAAGEPRDQAVDDPARDLRSRVEKVNRDVLAKRHERAAMSLACLVMVLGGALTAMRLGGSLPLAVYLWSFFPALGCVITVAAGQNMVHNLGPGGLVMLWGGVAILAVYAAGAFLLVRKH